MRRNRFCLLAVVFLILFLLPGLLAALDRLVVGRKGSAPDK